MTEPTRVIPMPTPGRQRRGVLAPVLGLIALGICGLVVLGLVSTSVGPAGAVVGTLCALLPVGPVVATFLWIDRWEPEPPRILLFAFLWGACVSALGALLINSSVGLLAVQALGSTYGALFGAVVVAPVVEETIKGLFLLGMLIFRRREFDGVVDGIVYGGLVAAGFAFSENILYLGRAFTEDAGIGQLGSVLTVLVLRGVLSPFAHPLFTVMIGIGAGIAARTNSMTVRIGAVAIGFVAAVGVHSLWNAAASVLGGGLFEVIYGFVMVPAFLALVVVVVWQRRREQRTVAAQLPGFAAAGWIVPSEVSLLSSMAGRQGWRSAVRKRSGRKVAKAVAEYQAAVTELAFLRARMERGTVGVAGPLWHAEAVDTVRRARARVVGHPDALTVAIRDGPQGWSPPSAGPPPGPPPPGSPPPGSPPPGSPPGGRPGPPPGHPGRPV